MPSLQELKLELQSSRKNFVMEIDNCRQIEIDLLDKQKNYCLPLKKHR